MRLLRTAVLLALAAGLPACGAGSPAATGPLPAPSPTAAALVRPGDAATGGPVPTGAPAGGAAVELVVDGLIVQGIPLPFGSSYQVARPALDAALGPPTGDSGEQDAATSPQGACPGTTVRTVSYAGGSLLLLFGDVETDTPALYGWQLSGRAGGLQARAQAGDAAFRFGLGTTLAQLRAGVGTDRVTLLPGTPPFFEIDAPAPLGGNLSGASPQDRVTFLFGGRGCSA